MGADPLLMTTSIKYNGANAVHSSSKAFVFNELMTATV